VRTNAKLATKFCVECSEKLCESCVEIHRRLSVTRKHKLGELTDNRGSMDRVMKSKTMYCEEHTDKASELYGFECKKTICVTCHVRLRKSHECSDVKEVAEKFQKLLTIDIKNMRDAVAACRKLVKEGRDYQVEFNRMLDLSEKEICDRVDKLKQLIESEKTDLL